MKVRALKIGIFVSLSPSIRPVFGQYSISKCSRTEISSAKCIITAPSAHVCSALKAWWPFAEIVTGKKGSRILKLSQSWKPRENHRETHLNLKNLGLIGPWHDVNLISIIYLNHNCKRLIKPKIFSIPMQASATKYIVILVLTLELKLLTSNIRQKQAIHALISFSITVILLTTGKIYGCKVHSLNSMSPNSLFDSFLYSRDLLTWPPRTFSVFSQLQITW